MISWTLDKNNYTYWTTNDSGEIEWGYPQNGDEVIIDDNFKYIFKVPEKEFTWKLQRFNTTTTTTDPTVDYNTTPFSSEPPVISGTVNVGRPISENLVIYTGVDYAEQFNQAIREHVENGYHGEATLSGTYTQTNETESIDDVRIIVEVYPTEEPTDEIALYLQEANKLMNGR